MARNLICKFRLVKALNIDLSAFKSRNISTVASFKSNLTQNQKEQRNCRNTIRQVRWVTSVAQPNISSATPPTVTKRTDVLYSDLVDGIASCSLCVVDVRDPKEVSEEGCIPTSTNIPLGKLKASLQMENDEFQECFKITKPESSDGSDLVFYGRSSVKGLAALEIAHKLGYKKARHFVGGYEEWCLRQKDG